MIHFRTICRWGLSFFSWYIVIFQLISIFMEYKLIKMYDSINFIWNTNRDLDFQIISNNINIVLYWQAIWLCLDTLYSNYASLFQINKKNLNASDLSKYIIKKLVNVNLNQWKKIMEKHPTLILNIKRLSQYAINCIEDIIQFIFAFIRMYISIYYSKNYIIVAYCGLLGFISLSSLFYFKKGIENDKKEYAKRINCIDNDFRKSLSAIEEYIRQNNTNKVIKKFNQLIDNRTNAENLSNLNQHNKNRFTQIGNRIIYCIIRLIYVVFFTQGMKTSQVHRQYILLTIGASSANEIINRMNNLINLNLNAEKDCHRMIESINTAIKIERAQNLKKLKKTLIIKRFSQVVGSHITKTNNLNLSWGIYHLIGKSKSGKTAFLQGLAGYHCPLNIGSKSSIIIDDITLSGKDIASFSKLCFYLNNRIKPFMINDWWLKKDEILCKYLFIPDEINILEKHFKESEYFCINILDRKISIKLQYLYMASIATPILLLDDIDYESDIDKSTYLYVIKYLSQRKIIIMVSAIKENINQKYLLCEKGLIKHL